MKKCIVCVCVCASSQVFLSSALYGSVVDSPNRDVVV